MRKLAMSLAFAMVFSTLVAGSAMAGPSQYYFDEFGYVFLELSQLTTLMGSDMYILVKIDPSSPDDIGVGFSYYNTEWDELCLKIFSSDYWYSHSLECTWVGNGTVAATANSNGIPSTTTLYTQPPTTVSSSVDPTVR